MNRRDFLLRAAATVAASAIDPELLIWQPGKKTIFLPSQKVGSEVWIQFLNGNIVKSISTSFMATNVHELLSLGDYVRVFDSEVHRAKGVDDPIVGKVIKLEHRWLKEE